MTGEPLEDLSADIVRLLPDCREAIWQLQAETAKWPNDRTRKKARRMQQLDDLEYFVNAARVLTHRLHAAARANSQAETSPPRL